MKLFLIFVFLGITALAGAQDTTNLVKFNDGSKSFWLYTKKDSVIKYLYPGGRKEAILPIKKYQITGTYTRWYENGKIMWEKEMLNGVQNGTTVLYDDKGIKLAEFTYEKGIMTDTVFIKENTHIILGKVMSSSKVYGGMVNADGTSNISEYSGPYMCLSMYAGKVDSLKKTELIQYFKTDYQGDFFIVAPVGKIGFFPKSVDIKTLIPGQYYIPQQAWSSGFSGWSMQGPNKVLAEDQLLLVTLNYSSVGYAP